MAKRVLIIGNVFPESKSSAAGAKMLQWLRFFEKYNFEVFYASTATQNEYSDDISTLTKSTFQIKVNDTHFEYFIEEISPDIVLYDQFQVEEQFGWRIRKVNSSIVHLLETQDLHFLRFARSKNIDIRNEITKRELAAILRCDCSFVISRFEKELLEKEFPFVKDLITYFPLCYNLDARPFQPFEERKDFCFIGNFCHAPNVDAVIFLKEIWHIIHKRLPTVKLHIYGAYPTERILQLNNESEGFIVHGRALSVQDIFTEHRILLAPIRFGAGLKGKLLEAMKYGIVSITTPLGAEGITDDMSFWNGKVVALSRVAEESIILYNQSEEYVNYQQVGISILSDSFKIRNFQNSVLKLINTIFDDVDRWRERHFLSQLMNHHRQQAVRYLSKWIEEKQKLGK